MMETTRRDSRQLQRLLVISLALVGILVIGVGVYRMTMGSWPLLAAEDKRENPGVATLEEAQAQVPFEILTPGYLPKGVRLSHISVLTKPPRGPDDRTVEPNGVNLTFSIDGEIVFTIAEEIGELAPDLSTSGEKVGQVVIRGQEAVLWRETRVDGKPVYLLAWNEPSNSLVFYLSSLLSQEETIRIANSLQ